ncbi:MAG: DUF4132 domain-containing protein [Sandaracinus sp.]
MASSLDLDLAFKAYWQGNDLAPARAFIVAAPREVLSLLDDRKSFGGSWMGLQRRRMLLEALREVTPSGELAEVMFELALCTRREERELAQAALARADVPIERLIAAMADGAKERREHAAGWLARLRAKEAVPSLLAAFRKEKVELVRAAMLRALVGLGEPVERFLDRDALAREAQKVLSKGVPPTLAFLSLDTLPSVTWSDGVPVAEPIVHAWLVTALKTKSPIASPLLTAYAAEMNAREREALGKAIYDRWLDEDFRLPTELDGDVRERLDAWAEKAGLTLEAFARTPAFKMHVGSLSWMIGKSVDTGALDQRGVLAVAAALAPRTLVPLCVKYVRDFRGLRIGSSRAMLHMLAGMDDRAATQALVRLSMRFRTASLRKEAQKLVSELAASRGWTPEELADHTIPTADLDDDGTLRLAYVENRVAPSNDLALDDTEPVAETRAFEAVLDEHLELGLFALGPDGTRSAIAKLPEPRKDEDAAQASLEKKRLAASKKELKALVVAQRERLFASMCSERAMAIGDFRTLYLAHPIMRRLLSRVVLAVRDRDGRELGACRVSEDGSFVTADNDTLVAPDDASIVIAHGSRLGRDVEARFLDHLAEYELSLLFPQLGRALHALDPAQPGLLRLTPAQAATVSSFALRGRMKRLGWERGPSGHGGWVDRYVKPFVSLGLEAALLHTPVPQPETDTPIQIEGIEVLTLPPAGAPLHAPRSVVLVRALPTVLRHELWNDLLAALG